MDIHRARFIPHPSPAINALAFSANHDGDLSKGGLKNLRLAVGRNNGDIEVWNPLKGAWARERTFHAGQDRSIEALLWTQEPSEYEGNNVTSTGQLRLFSIGHSNAVTEWHLSSGLPVNRETGGNLSTIWCFAAQPRMHQAEARKAAAEGKPRGQDIVVGCEDGSIALLSTADNDLQFSKYIARSQSKSVRALSIAFRDRHTVAVGFSNSTVRIYDIRNSSVVRTVTLGAGKKGGPKNLFVWALKWLPNGDLVTGDSAGEVRYFEGNMFSQSQRIVAHTGDIFSIAVNKDGTRLFTAGSDRKTSMFQRSAKARQWRRMGHKFYHEHDVKALAIYDGDKTQKMSFLAQGGLDTNLSIVPVEQYGEEYHRVISGLPQQPQITTAPSARLAVSWEGNVFDVWRIKTKLERASKKRMHRHVASARVKGDESITSCHLSSDGHYLAVATSTKTRIFEITMASEPTEPVQILPVNLGGLLRGGTSVRFSPDMRWISIVSPANELSLFKLDHSGDTLQVTSNATILRRIKRGADTSSLQAYRRAITQQAFSADSKVFVVVDLSGFVDCWTLNPELSDVETKYEEESDDSSDEEEDADMALGGPKWNQMASAKALPQLDSSALILTFRPGKKTKQPQINGIKHEESAETNGEHSTQRTKGANEDTAELISHPNNKYEIFILTAQHQLYEFDLSGGKLTDWARRNPTQHLPETFRKIKDRAMGSYWHVCPSPDDAQRLYLYGSNWVYMLDVAQDLDIPAAAVDEDGLINTSKKRKWEGDSGAGDKIKDSDHTGFKPGVEVNGGVPQKRLKTAEPSQAVSKDEEEEADSADEEDVHASRSLRIKQVANTTELNQNPVDKARKTWHSFAYRPILTVLPLAEKAEYIETVIVERPMWELDLPPRLLGPHDKPL